MARHKQYQLSAAEWEYLIDQWVIGRNGERDRAILKRKMIAGVTFDALTREFDLSHQRVEQIVYGRLDSLIPHIEMLGKR